MKPLLAGLSLIILLAACDTIRVDSSDPTPPDLIVNMPAAQQLEATYAGGGQVRGPIDTTRTFEIQVPRDRRSVQLLFNAFDRESGIRLLRGTMEVTFTCHARVLLGPVDRTASTTFTADSLTPAEPNSDVPPRRLLAVDFTLEDLWRRGNCSTWDAVVDVNSGRLSDIVVRYDALATNNRRPLDPAERDRHTSTISGQFSIAPAGVELDD